MDFYETACKLSELLQDNRAVYLHTEPEAPDFTSPGTFKIIVCGMNDCIEYETDRSNLIQIIGQFDSTVFDKESVDRLYTWNFKALATYFHFHNPSYLAPKNTLIDLKVIENFLGIKKNPPKNLAEFISRTRSLSKGWQSIYKTVHLPLMLKVLPSMEAAPLLNETTKSTVHPYYEIEGQINGRMNCLNRFKKCYTPHNMGPDVRASLKPRGYHMRFVYSDFRHCEINVLQWLSKDQKLKEIIDSGDDVHQKIYEMITGDQCNTDMKRRVSKKIFLPVMYGLGAANLGRDIGLSEEVAGQLIKRIKTTFATSWEWMQERQEAAKSGIVTDYFGRPRQFEPNTAYLARNFSVQGVAATVCQEKLIRLDETLDPQIASIVFSVHDGFGLVCQASDAKKAFDIIKSVCESESVLCPGLLMKVEVKFGTKLDNLKVFWK